MQNHTVSLCMIVRDEEKHLDRCLKSVQGKVDEIVVVDTGSVDGTVEIARKYNAVIKHFDWINDFSAARNYSISEIGTEYILILDADEYLDDNADLQKDLAQDKDYYKVLIKNYEGDGKNIIHQYIRLFKSGVGLRFSGRLHEHLNTYEKDSDYKGANSDIVIHHVGYLPEIISDKDKNKRNYDIMLNELNENPTGYSYFNMGKIYLSGGQYDKALDMFKKSYPLSKKKTYVKGLLVRIGECLNLMNRAEEGIILLSDAINVYPDYTDLHYTLGILFMNFGYLRDAEAEFEECLKLGEKVENITIEGVGSYLADYQLAYIYEKKGRRAEAFDKAFKALMGNKNYFPALTLYLKLMQSAGIRAEEIRKQMEVVYPVSSAKELSNLISALYKIRNRLIKNYDFAFTQEDLANVRAVAYMLNGDYAKSIEEWAGIDFIPDENLTDVMVLSLLSGDMSLAEKLRYGLNLNEKEWKYLVRILSMEEASKSHITEDIEKQLLYIANYLLDIKAFEQFEYISGFLIKCSVETQNKLAEQLINRNHIDTALELLSLNIDRYPGNYEVLMLAGDAMRIKNDIDSALEFYYESLKQKDYYPVYERIYEIYEGMGAKDKLNDMLAVMRDKFPLSNWLKRA